MERKYPDHPIVGVGAIIFQGEQVLLIKRGRAPGLGEWSIPGGAVEPGETLKEALVREVREETHLEVEVLALAKVLERIFREPDGRVAYHYVLVDFLCGLKGGVPQSDSDAEEVRFVSLQDLPAYRIAPVTLHVIRRAAWLRENPEGLKAPADFAELYDR